jgi:hypothetical protein
LLLPEVFLPPFLWGLFLFFNRAGTTEAYGSSSIPATLAYLLPFGVVVLLNRTT